MSEKTTEFYVIKEVVIDETVPRIQNQMIMRCGLCGHVIRNSGAMSGAICKPCGNELRYGRLRGCVVWQEDDQEKLESK